MKARGLVLTFTLLGIVVAQGVERQTVSFGKWKLSHDGKGRLSLVHGNRELLSGVGVGCWTEGYAKGLFFGLNYTLHENGNVVTVLDGNDSAKLSLRFVFSANRVEIISETDVLSAPAVTECSFPFDLDAFKVGDAPAFMWVDGVYAPVHFGSLGFRVVRTIAFDSPEGRYTLQNEGTTPLSLQDCRQDGSGKVRYVFTGTCKEPKKFVVKASWTVDEAASAEEVATRRIAFGTPLEDIRSPDFPNLDFKSGTDGWNVPVNAGIDQEAARSGDASMRITVTDVKRDGVYVTRLYPIVGGSTYEVEGYLKTKDVVETKGGIKGSAGAGVFVEWADDKGGYLWGGAERTGNRGTADWRKFEIQRLKAPDNARQMRIYLSLRDTGTAWFKGLKVREVVQVFERVSPVPGAVLTNNCPFFVWKGKKGVRRCWVELSRDPAFPPNATQTCDSPLETSLQWKKPLAPGLWYWRVAAPGIGGNAWSFRQMASAETDCLPPEILTRAARLTNATDRLTVRLGGSDVRGVTCRGIVGRCERRDAASGEGVYSFAAPHGGWPKGYSEPEVVATDRNGNVSRRNLWLLNASVPDNAVKVGKDGYYWEKGRRIFPIGIYEVNESEMPKIRKDGFDVVHSYRWEGSQDDKACRAYLDACWRTDGLRAFIGFDRGKESLNGVIQGNYRHVARRVGALADHPGLFCWYLFDEPMVPSQYISPERLAAFADLIRTLDPYHPVVVSTWWETMGEYRKSWDTHWTQAYGYPYGAAQLAHDQMRYLEGYDSPMTLLLNCNCMDIPWRNGRDVDTTKFSRDYDEFRAAACLSFVLNCNGLFYWWYAPDNTYYYSASQCPRAWADLTRVIREIRVLRPLVLADAPSQSGTVKVGRGGVEWWTKTVDGISYFVAVNTLPDPVDVEVDVPGDGRQKLHFDRYETKFVKRTIKEQ